jgi:hypothetical protein
VIHKGGDFRCQLEAGLAKSGYQVFLALGRSDGLPLMYEMKPHLIFLGVGQDHEDIWETLSRIRLLTDIPTILLVDNIPSEAASAASQPNTVFLPADSPISTIMAQIKSFQDLASSSQQKADGEDAKEEIVPLTFLCIEDLLAIDRALDQVRDLGEIRLTWRNGRLQTLEKLETETVDLEPQG